MANAIIDQNFAKNWDTTKKTQKRKCAKTRSSLPFEERKTKTICYS